MNFEIKLAQIATSDYSSQYRDVDKFIEFCKVCNNYKRVWSCPPFQGDKGCHLTEVDDFLLTTIIGVKIDTANPKRCEITTIEERNQAVKDIILEARKELDSKLLALEQQIKPSRLYYAGSCQLCAGGECRRTENRECRYPTKMRSTLEAIGFDMERTTSELLGIEMKWCEGLQLPPYFTLVYGLLSNESISEQIKKHLQI